ncbi:hypothetical protein pb186bvf_008072 [Paramecium bursaria]
MILKIFYNNFLLIKLRSKLNYKINIKFFYHQEKIRQGFIRKKYGKIYKKYGKINPKNIEIFDINKIYPIQRLYQNLLYLIRLYFIVSVLNFFIIQIKQQMQLTNKIQLSKTYQFGNFTKLFPYFSVCFLYQKILIFY